MSGFVFEPTAFRYGRVRSFTAAFFVARDPGRGPGWYVWGRSIERVIKVVARPDVQPRRHPHYNIRVRRGWNLNREAEQVCAGLSIQRAEPDLPVGDTLRNWAIVGLVPAHALEDHARRVGPGRRRSLDVG